MVDFKNGRLAMMAITGFAIQEAVYKTPVIEQTPIFFTPFWTFFWQMMGQ